MMRDDDSEAPVAGPPARGRALRGALGGLALLFGAGTVLQGGHVLFGGEAAWEEAGAVVPFVLVFNFAAGFVYLASGALTLAARSSSLLLARLLAVSTVAVFAAFLVHVASGGAFEVRTVMAMTLRSGFWITEALLLPRVLRSPGGHATRS